MRHIPVGECGWHACFSTCPFFLSFFPSFRELIWGNRAPRRLGDIVVCRACHISTSSSPILVPLALIIYLLDQFLKRSRLVPGDILMRSLRIVPLFMASAKAAIICTAFFHFKPTHRVFSSMTALVLLISWAVVAYTDPLNRLFKLEVGAGGVVRSGGIWLLLLVCCDVLRELAVVVSGCSFRGGVGAC